MLEVAAPARADLAGGTLDLWPLYCLHRPAVTVNAALTAGVRLRLFADAVPPGRLEHVTPDGAVAELTAADVGRDLVATVAFHLIPTGGLRVEVVEQLPVGSGLGGSSVLAVALARGCLALTGRSLPARPLVGLLHDLEAEVLGVPTGAQDYYPALLGGPLAIHLEPGGETVERLAVPAPWLAPRLLVVYSGITHHSGMVNWEVFRARMDGDRAVAERLDRIAAAARACRAALLTHDTDGVGRAVNDEWRARRALAPAVSPPDLERLLAAGRSAGALAAKACGAGGGGSVLFWVRPEQRAAVLAAALASAPAGAHEVGGGISRRGVRIIAAT